MNILIRADSSSHIGTGHIMRTLVLAKKYENANIIFATQNLEGNINYKIEEENYKIELLKTNAIKELDDLIKTQNINMLIIDHYEINYDFEKELKELNPALKIFVFDDTYEKHYCDILLNHNISANKKRYKNLVPRNCELRCGSKYTLLRDEFYIQKKKRKEYLKKLKEKKRKNIFIAMGGADHSNINIPILEVLSEFKDIKVNIVTITANKNLKSLQKYCKNKSWINLHINSNKIAKLMAKSSFAITTPSVTANELYFLGVPFIAIQTASNQNDMTSYLEKKKFIVLKKFDTIKLSKQIQKLINKK